LHAQFANPFALEGQWFKGNLHTHSTLSDGELSPEAVLAWYRGQGYHFLALTDHDLLARARQVAQDFITIGGIEVEGIDPDSGLYHLIGLGATSQPDLGVRQVFPMQEAVRRLLAVSRLAVLAHPYWSGQMSKDLLAPDGCVGLEILNGGCEVDAGRGYSTVHWDDVLAAGRRIWGLAVDDAHWLDGSKDAGLGWIWAKAPVLSEKAILDALEQGYFYASSGPQIHDVQWDEAHSEVCLRCSPAAWIDFVGDGWRSHRITAPVGQDLTEACYHPQEGQRYLRVACRGIQGGWAWSNPMFLDE
jgi:hypothetical protein